MEFGASSSDPVPHVINVLMYNVASCIVHSDRGSQGGFTLGALHRAARGDRRQTLVGTVADSYDALTETTNGLYKAECVYGPDARGWDDVDELELATLSWVHWFNEDRLHGHCRDVPPAEFYAAPEANPAGVGMK